MASNQKADGQQRGLNQQCTCTETQYYLPQYQFSPLSQASGGVYSIAAVLYWYSVCAQSSHWSLPPKCFVTFLFIPCSLWHVAAEMSHRNTSHIWYNLLMYHHYTNTEDRRKSALVGAGLVVHGGVCAISQQDGLLLSDPQSMPSRLCFHLCVCWLVCLFICYQG